MSASDEAEPPDVSGADIDPLTTSLVTGPAEHFFLSADAALTQIRQVKYNSESKSFETEKKPTEFLVGTNYQIGDLLSDDDRNFFRGLYLSFLVEASKRPFNQIGAAIGFRNNLPYLDSYVSLRTVSPYIGYSWVRNDEADGNQSGDIKSRYGKPQLIGGLSFNLDKALNWLGGGSATSSEQ